jgi:nitrogen fixation protein FixH
MTTIESTRAGRYWAWGPGLLLTALLGTQLTVLHFVLRDPAFAVEPDYYRQAITWDERQELERQSRALGWHASLSAGMAPGGVEMHTELRLTDAAGAALEGATVRAHAFQNARASQIFDVALLERIPGSYAADIPSGRVGLWEFRLEATRGAAAFRTVLRSEVSVGGGTP